VTSIGTGGIRFSSVERIKPFERQFKKLDSGIRKKADGKIDDLLKHPFPPGLAFEKLKGYSNPDVYTIHVTGNYKISFQVIRFPEIVDGSEVIKVKARLRSIGTHNLIDRSP
jgi:mRNA-degrading endonuclease RelE of RelBE toxin-antitoxin system